MSTWDLRRQFPSLVQDRVAEVAYSLSDWLTQEAPPSAADWLIAAFAAVPGPLLSGKSFPARSF
jgi:hypothetical protein